MYRRLPSLPMLHAYWKTYWHWKWIDCWTRMVWRWPFCPIWLPNGLLALYSRTFILGQSTKAFKPYCRSVFWCHCCWPCCRCRRQYWNIPQHLRPSCHWHCPKLLCGVQRSILPKHCWMAYSMRKISHTISVCRRCLRMNGNVWMCRVCCVPFGRFGEY